MHDAFGNGSWDIFDMISSHSIALARPSGQPLKMKILQEKSSWDSQRRSKGLTWRQEMLSMSLWAWRSRRSWGRRAFASPQSWSTQQDAGWLGLAGDMGKYRMGCTSMGMKGKMWWNINSSLLHGGKQMNFVFINGTMTEMNSHSRTAFQSLVRLATFDSFSSLTMSLFSIKTMSTRPCGSTSLIRQHWGPRVMASQLWCLIFLHRSGAICTRVMSVFFFCFSLFYHSNCKSLRDARVLFKAGKNRSGWFSSEDLLAQVDRAIDIFEELTKGYAQGLFLFNNAPSYQKQAPDAISAWKMVKGV